MHSGPLLGPVAALPLTTNSAADPLGSNSLLPPHGSQQPTKEELKTQFVTREGLYRVMTLAEYSRPNRVPLNQLPGTGGGSVGSGIGGGGGGAPVRVSFLSVEGLPQTTNGLVSPSPVGENNREENNGTESNGQIDPALFADRMCFNVGRELYVYLYRGTDCAADLTKPIDKRVYKGTYPTCHHFNAETATATSCSLIIGFSAGQIQLIDPFQKEYTVSRLYNEERLIDKTSVTCLKWIPGQPQHFIVSHSSGLMFVYNEELPCPQSPPTYQVYKQGDRFTVFSCKGKSSKNPIYKWQIGEGAISQFSFSNDGTMMATVGHDGFLRIFNYQSMELVCYMKSYFGGLLCLSWSPDNKLIATGGEDDLLSVYNVAEKRVVCRGQGHKSWISQVSFDPYTCTLDADELLATQTSVMDLADDELKAGTSASSSGVQRRHAPTLNSLSRLSFASFGTSMGATTSHSLGVCYRIGSVGHDTQLCLWDITDDLLKSSVSSQRHRNSTIIAPVLGIDVQSPSKLDTVTEQSSSVPTPQKEKKKVRLHKRGLTLAAKLTGSGGERNRDLLANAARTQAIEEARLLGTRICPRIDEVAIIEPLICKKISHERLTVLEFRRDCLVTACQEGFICTWARPGKGSMSLMKREVNSPSGLVGASPNENIQNGVYSLAGSSLGTSPYQPPSSYWNG